ncbi:MAG: hypothetical protein HYY08_03865 [Firmicutes bacterium]|nr:hypothetical protein [Bacillota bacterium]
MSADDRSEPGIGRVSFSYAFATPHRLTVARPDSGDKTLLDLQPGSLRMAWSYDNLTCVPPLALVPPVTAWEVRVQPEVDGHPFAYSAWCRVEGYLPVLSNTYVDTRGWVRLEVAGCASAALARVQVTNTGERFHRFNLRCEVPGGWAGYNPAWVDGKEPCDCLLAGFKDRADRVLVFGLGAEEHPVSSNALCLSWNLRPGGSCTGWVVRPYRSYAAELPELKDHDWQREFEEAKEEWRNLLGRAIRVKIPDLAVERAFYACLGDLFIMREPAVGGCIATVPGTESYRAASSGETAIVSVALDQVGLHEEAAAGYQMCLDQQEADGAWADPRGWAHLMWCMSGFKAWAVIEHYRLTGDRDYLAKVYPRMVASSRWQERQRARTRVMEGGERPLTYGLMPRGMGDCGLKDDDDMYGVFLPHNIWAVFADRHSVQAAEILGRTEDLAELHEIFEVAREDLLQALERGAIAEEGYRWIPGVPGKRCGSRWGVLNSLFPCGILPADHELISGTIQHLESSLSPGGLPLHTGWMTDGMWVAMALDNLCEVHLVRGDSSAAIEYLYAVLDHGTPLYTWCEERGQEPGTGRCTGDRQHLWTPVAVVRAIRDFLVMEDGNGLHLARGTARAWLASGQPVGIAGAPTHFGLVSYEMQYDRAAARLNGRVVFPEDSSLAWATLHIRLPHGLRVTSVNPECRAAVLPDGAGVHWKMPLGELRIEASIGRSPYTWGCSE